MLYQAHTKGYLAASPSKRKVANQAPMQVIPLVMEPKVRLKGLMCERGGEEGRGGEERRGEERRGEERRGEERRRGEEERRGEGR